MKAWLGREGSNLRMGESKSPALPLGYAPTAEATQWEPADRFGSAGLQRDLWDFNHLTATFPGALVPLEASGKVPDRDVHAESPGARVRHIRREGVPVSHRSKAPTSRQDG